MHQFFLVLKIHIPYCKILIEVTTMEDELRIQLNNIRQEKAELEFLYSDELFQNNCLKKKRNMLNISIISNLVSMLYFFVWYGMMGFFENANRYFWGILQSDVFQNLLNLSNGLTSFVKIIATIAMLIIFVLLLYKIYKIWLNSDLSSALSYAKQNNKASYGLTLEESNIKISKYYIKISDLKIMEESILDNTPPQPPSKQKTDTVLFPK